METTGRKPVCGCILQNFGIVFPRKRKARTKLSRRFDRIETIYAEYFLDQIDFTRNIRFEQRNFYRPAISRGPGDDGPQTAEYFFYSVGRYPLSNQLIQFFFSQNYPGGALRYRIYILQCRGNLPSCKLEHQPACFFKRRKGQGGIHAALVSERCIGFEVMSAGRLANGHRVKTCALQKYGLCFYRDTRMQSANHARNSKWFFFIADHQ